MSRKFSPELEVVVFASGVDQLVAYTSDGNTHAVDFDIELMERVENDSVWAAMIGGDEQLREATAAQNEMRLRYLAEGAQADPDDWGMSDEDRAEWDRLAAVIDERLEHLPNPLAQAELLIKLIWDRLDEDSKAVYGGDRAAFRGKVRKTSVVMMGRPDAPDPGLDPPRGGDEPSS